MNSKALWDAYNKFTLRKAKQYAPAVYKAIQAQIKYYTETQDLTNLPQQAMQQVLSEVYTETGRQWAANTYYRILNEAGIQNQLSLDEIINNLLSSEITKNRAALIARTETGKAANAAEQIGSDKTGLQTRKEWIAVRDFRTRHDHINVDGKIVPDGEPFNVGGYMMLRPGAIKTTDGLRVPA